MQLSKWTHRWHQGGVDDSPSMINENKGQYGGGGDLRAAVADGLKESSWHLWK